MAGRRTAVAGLVLWLVACGGGGGGGGGSGSAGSSGSDAVAYPSLTPSSTFSLPTISAPPERASVAGVQQGRVLIAPGVPGAAGLTVEWLDASSPDVPVVLASATTGIDGSYTINGQSGTLAAADQWLRVSLADGSVLRGYATGWVELTPGTEAAVRELARLRRAGAFTSHALAASELANAQGSATLAWLGAPVTRPPAAAADALVEQLRFLAPWNSLLTAFSGATVTQGAGDVSGLMPIGETAWPSTLVLNGSTSAATFRSTCFSAPSIVTTACSIQSSEAPDLIDGTTVRRTGISRVPSGDASPLSMALTQVGELPLIEFPAAVGTRLLYDNKALLLPLDSNTHGSIRVTRRTYPAEAVAALGRQVQAVRVVLDLEVALLDMTTRQQSDTLIRESRWYAPGQGRVRFEKTTLRRSAPQTSIGTGSAAVTTTAVAVGADSVTGTFFAGPAIPYPGVMDVRAIGLQHRHAVYSSALNRIYVASPANGGQILELDADSLVTLRTLATGAVPGRLAVSADGRSLYAGLDGGEVADWRITDLAPMHRTALPVDSFGVRYQRVADISIDPFDPQRVVLLAGGNSGALLVYRQGALVLRDAPSYDATDYGWGRYSPNAVAWSTVRDEYLAAFLGSPKSLFRFHADESAGRTSEVSSLSRVDDVGWLDVGGSVLTSAGTSLDALTFTAQRTLSLGQVPLTECRRQDAVLTQTDLCKLGGAGYLPPIHVRLDHATSAFRGTYRLPIVDIPDGCSGTNVRSDASVLGLPTLTPMSAGKNLVSVLDASSGEAKCSLQVWTMHGVP